MSGCNSFIIPKRRLYSPAGLRHCKKKLLVITMLCASQISVLITNTKLLTSPLGSPNLAWRNSWCMRTICCEVSDFTAIFGLNSWPISPAHWKCLITKGPSVYPYSRAIRGQQITPFKTNIIKYLQLSYVQ